MSEDNLETSGVLHYLDRIDNKLDRIQDKQVEQGETLVRNTVTLEQHVKRTNLLEEKVNKVEDEVVDINAHVKKINGLLSLFKPTMKKAKWVALLASLAGGGWGGYEVSTDPGMSKKAQQVIEFIFK